MINNTVTSPELFFAELGGVHDSAITSFTWDKHKQMLTIGLDDLNSSFLGLSEYQGKRPVTLTFVETVFFDIDIQHIDDQLNIYVIEVSANNDSYMVHVKFSPSGYFKCQCKSIQIFDSNLSLR